MLKNWPQTTSFLGKICLFLGVFLCFKGIFLVSIKDNCLIFRMAPKQRHGTLQVLYGCKVCKVQYNILIINNIHYFYTCKVPKSHFINIKIINILATLQLCNCKVGVLCPIFFLFLLDFFPFFLHRFQQDYCFTRQLNKLFSLSIVLLPSNKRC